MCFVCHHYVCFQVCKTMSDCIENNIQRYCWSIVWKISNSETDILCYRHERNDRLDVLFENPSSLFVAMHKKGLH